MTDGYDKLTLVGRHVPDPGSGPFATMQDAQAAGYDVLKPTTGMYEVGALIDGQFVTIISEKASLIFDRVQAAKDASAAAWEESASKGSGKSGSSTSSTG